MEIRAKDRAAYIALSLTMFLLCCPVAMYTLYGDDIIKTALLIGIGACIWKILSNDHRYEKVPVN